MEKRFEKGSQWLYQKHVVEVDGATSLDTVAVWVLGTQEYRNVPVAALSPMPATVHADATGMPQAQWDGLVTIARSLMPFRDLTVLPVGARAELARALDFSERTVQRRRREYQKNQLTMDMAPRKTGRPIGKQMLDPQVEQAIAACLDEFFERREPASATEIFERTRMVCRQRGLRPPCLKTIRARITQRRGRTLETKQKGSKAAAQLYEARPGAQRMTRPLEQVQIDHTCADIMLVDEHGNTTGRPWLTLAIDVATRVVVGYYLAMHEPSAISVAMCVAHMMCPKPENALAADFWPMYGRAAQILVDNGRDLRSMAFQRGCEQHGIELIWRPVGKPHYGAHIERLMGTLMQQVHTLPGTTFSRPHHKGDYDAQGKASLTLEQFRRWLLERICRGYHVRPHRGLDGKAPLIAWEEGHRDADGRLLLPPIPMDAESLHRDFFPSEVRRLQRTGIQLGGTRYWAPELADLVGPNAMIRVHFNPQQPEVVWPRLPDGRLVEARAVAGRAITGPRVPMSIEQRERLEDLLAEGYRHGDAVVATARTLKRQRRKPHADGPSVAPPVDRPALPARVAFVEVDE
jgi:putative transposase